MGKPRIAGKGRGNPYADVQVELTAMIFDRVLPTIMTGGVLMVVATAALARYYHDPWLWGLTGIIGALWCGRVAIVLRYAALPPAAMTVPAARRWELLYGVYTAFFFCTMGASTLRSMRAPDNIHFMYCSFGSFVICNAIGARLGLRPVIVFLQSGPMIAAMMIAILHQPSLMGRCTVFLLLGYGFTYSEATKVKFDITVEQLRSRRRQRHLAEHDALTGLANRRHFEQRLATLCKENDPFAVFFLDLDGFKKVNDLHGHATGDLLLQHVAERLQGAVRGSDLAARLGGDEFAILHASNVTRETASALAARLIERISAPYEIDPHELRVGASIGIQLSGPGTNNPDTLLSRADHALYAVKQAGKGSFLFAEEDRRPLACARAGNAPPLTARTVSA